VRRTGPWLRPRPAPPAQADLTYGSAYPVDDIRSPIRVLDLYREVGWPGDGRLVGRAGFEPANGGSKVRCLTTWPPPRIVDNQGTPGPGARLNAQRWHPKRPRLACGHVR